MNLRLHNGHLTTCPLYGNANGLIGGGKKGLVKTLKGNKFRIQLRQVPDRNRKTQIVHDKNLVSQFFPAAFKKLYSK